VYVIVITIEDDVVEAIRGVCSEYGIPIPECLLMMLFGGVECESGEMDRVPERVSGA